MAICDVARNGTIYEQMSLLSDIGWTWNLWIPPSARGKKTPVIPDAYRHNIDKDKFRVYFTTLTISRQYLSCLLLAQELVCGHYLEPHRLMYAATQSGSRNIRGSYSWEVVAVLRLPGLV